MNLWLQRRWREEINSEFEISYAVGNLLYIKQINNKVLVISTGNYIRYLLINNNEMRKKKGK